MSRKQVFIVLWQVPSQHSAFVSQAPPMGAHSTSAMPHTPSQQLPEQQSEEVVQEPPSLMQVLPQYSAPVASGLQIRPQHSSGVEQLSPSAAQLG